MNIYVRRAALAAAVAVGATGLVACESDQGPMEEAGESVDDTVDDAGDAMEDAGDSAEDSVN
ncbi:hypothetical protein [Marinivivus vitaminiproducens]|uniref:hypothetical protein n=1 Tax=Marinivivus vitaminiproducens TaxID=3035935 RepID=UPI002799E602|nr:hypothetical protein P4R82_02800 [Geminicoccaceae bacterium SCSIO 64248]